MSLKARAYRRWSRLYRTGLRAGDILQTGLWLGLLDRHDLHAFDEAEYVHRSNYRTDAHNLGGLFDWERRAVAEYFPTGGALVVLGAGGGREALALARLGYRAVGYECHPALVRYGRDLLARHDCPGAELHHLGRDRAPADGGPYAGAIVGWGAYMLITGRERRVSMLGGLRRRLLPGAPLLTSFYTRADDGRRAGLVAAVARPVRRLRRAPAVEVGDDLAPTYVHRFTEAEVAAELTAGGFELVEFAAERPGPTNPGYAVARAR
ncbi:hypothetical protein [Jidongwangia harbinensis]|uniref:hypothetical protein n=1 Tax=Jidongwangia harbinensis TaxID=2878561 RepID=UPI001CD969F8|nr:hypothetical protein [Jidongwangia harbinensis]MCA2214119.1 hypothetical protein [Jidongwangia harbinensis]